MATDTTSPLKRFTVPAYAVALVFLISPAADVVANAWPIDPGNIQWRFGAAGIASNYLLSVVMGLAIGVAAAAAAGSRVMTRLFTALSLLVGVLSALIALLLPLDVLQLRGNVREEALGMFAMGAMKAELKIAVTAVALLLLGIAGFKVARTQAQRPKGTPLLVREG